MIYVKELDEEEEEIQIEDLGQALLKWKTTNLKYMILWKKSTLTLWKSQELLT